MKLLSFLIALVLATLSGVAPSSAALFAFSFTPDTTLGYDIEADGTITTDDMPDISNVTAVAGHAGGLDILGIDNGYNILDPNTLAGYFSFRAVYDQVEYSFAFGPSAFANYAMIVTGADGSEFDAFGDLSIAPALVSAVPLPSSAGLFGAALAALGPLGLSLSRRRTAAAA